MRAVLAIAISTSLTVASASLAVGGPGKPVAAGPKSPKIAAAASPKTRPVTAGPKSPPKTPKTHPPKATGPKSTSATATPKHSKVPKAPTTAGTGVTAQMPKSNVPKNPKLAARLQTMLPVGMTIDQAASGFKNQGQFIAALHVSQNLGLSFADLKTSMVDGGFSLGQSIQHLRPSVDGDVEAARATKWANKQIEDPR